MDKIEITNIKGFLTSSEKYLSCLELYKEHGEEYFILEYPKGLYTEDSEINSIEDLVRMHEISIYWNLILPSTFYTFLFDKNNKHLIYRELLGKIENKYYVGYIIEISNNDEKFLKNIDEKFTILFDSIKCLKPLF